MHLMLLAGFVETEEPRPAANALHARAVTDRGNLAVRSMRNDTMPMWEHEAAANTARL